MIDRLNIKWERNKQILSQYLKDNPNSSISIVSSLSIPEKHAGRFALLPENLDLEAHIEQYPLTDYKFIDWYGRIRSVNIRGTTLGSYYDIERMIHILGIIASYGADNKDDIDNSRYVPIHSKRIRKYFKDYLSYLDYLIVTGIIVCDRQYIVGERPRMYKLASIYEKVPLRPYYYCYHNQLPVNSIEEEVYNKETDAFERNTLLDKLYLNSWYNQQRIEINSSAEEYAFKLRKSKQGFDDSDQSLWDISNVWDAEAYRYKRKNPQKQYGAIMQNINEIKIHHYKAKIDTNVHRLHSVLTNMQSEFRNFLTYDSGKQLISIDIKNSQPYLLCLLLRKEFWMESSTLPISINNVPLNIQNLFHASPEILSDIRNFIESVNETSFQEYINLVSNGNLYEEIVDRAIQLNKKSQITRKKAKHGLLVLFYSPNREYIEGITPRTYIVEKVFCEKFPTIMELFSLIKRDCMGTCLTNNYNRFARLLQSIESDIVLNRCCKRIWVEGNQQVPIFTIHDSIVTTIEHQDYVRRVMQETMIECIGIKPTLAIEAWHLSNLDETRCLPACV